MLGDMFTKVSFEVGAILKRATHVECSEKDTHLWKLSRCYASTLVSESGIRSNTHTSGGEVFIFRREQSRIIK
jgi:hypothetical protein